MSMVYDKTHQLMPSDILTREPERVISTEFTESNKQHYNLCLRSFQTVPDSTTGKKVAHLLFTQKHPGAVGQVSDGTLIVDPAVPLPSCRSVCYLMHEIAVSDAAQRVKLGEWYSRLSQEKSTHLDLTVPGGTLRDLTQSELDGEKQLHEVSSRDEDGKLFPSWGRLLYVPRSGR